MPEYTLTRTGNLPLRFEGKLIAEASSKWTNGRENNRWHVLKLYRTESRNYVLAIGFRTQWQGEQNTDVVIIAKSPADIQKRVADFVPLPPGVGYPPGEAYIDKQARLVNTMTTSFDHLVSDLFEGLEDEFAETID